MNIVDQSDLTIIKNPNGEMHVSGIVDSNSVDQTISISETGIIMYDPENTNFYFIPVELDPTHKILDII